jgi:hypothetical protein
MMMLNGSDTKEGGFKIYNRTLLMTATNNRVALKLPIASIQLLKPILFVATIR